ncbi:hypothetical protein DKT77_01105 [Meridianimarinicoccus roseus]|uniref:Uncharacterized protein n=1 Tax=Meridianimarinicoccus roseus TaxID=2072018 RepID=A0A2V2LGI8_9RHOB|nr:hypothetical protein DKT77_01105 [Meridianimarinicoccus roseus]
MRFRAGRTLRCRVSFALPIRPVTPKPANLSGYGRVRPDLGAPPYAPGHGQVATGGAKPKKSR